MKRPLGGVGKPVVYVYVWARQLIIVLNQNNQRSEPSATDYWTNNFNSKSR